MLGRCLLLMIAFAPGAGCGDAASNDAGVVILDAGIDGGYCQEWWRTSTCNPPANTGCNTGERCGLVHPYPLEPDARIEFEVCCMAPADPELALGAACTAEPGLPDDCEPGTYCSWGECRRLCSGPSCGRAPCNDLGRGLFGTCAPPCDAITLACPEGLSCYQPLPIAADEEDTACREHLEVGLDEPCYNPRQCAAGLTCVRPTGEPFALDYAINDGSCRPVCRVALNDCAPGSSCIGYLGTNYGACIVDQP